MEATLIILAIAGLAAAQNLDGVAPCVRSCIEKAIAGAGCTGTESQIAICACKPDTQAKLLAPVTQCATENRCDTSDLLKAQSIAAEQCKNLPTISSQAEFTSQTSSLANPTSQTNELAISASQTTELATPSSRTSLLSIIISYTSTSSSSQRGSITPTPSPHFGRPGLSGGTIAGIVIGLLVAIGVLLGAFCFYRRRRRSVLNPAQGNGTLMDTKRDPEVIIPGRNELPGSNAQSREEVKAEFVHEIDSYGRDLWPAEVDGNANNPRQHLDASELPASQECSQQVVGGSTIKRKQLAVLETETTDPATTELDALEKRQAQLEEERRHVRRLQEIDAEQVIIQQQIDQLKQQPPR